MSYWPSTPNMPPPTGEQIELRLEFAAAEQRVALRVDHLAQFFAGAARCEVIVAQHAGEAPEDEVGVFGVEAGQLETERALGAAQADFDRACGLNGEIGIADLEGARCLMHAVGQQFRRAWRALDVLRRRAGYEAERQVLQEARRRALGGEAALDSGLSGRDRIAHVIEHRDQVGREVDRGAVDLDTFDAAGDLCPPAVVEAELVEDVAGDALGRVRIEQAAADRGECRQLLMGRLGADCGGERGEPQVERHELDFDAAFLGAVGEGLLDAVEAVFVGEFVDACSRWRRPSTARYRSPMSPGGTRPCW